jgi:hypothetical protein
MRATALPDDWARVRTGQTLDWYRGSGVTQRGRKGRSAERDLSEV